MHISTRYTSARRTSAGHTSIKHLREADLRQADLTSANLFGANLNDANLSEAKLGGADLSKATLVNTDLTGADLTGCRIYGVSAWGLKLERTKQQNLVITPEKEPEVTVDNIEVAQFIYLMLNNQNIRGVIDTITSKAGAGYVRLLPEQAVVSARPPLRQSGAIAC